MLFTIYSFPIFLSKESFLKSFSGCFLIPQTNILIPLSLQMVISFSNNKAPEESIAWICEKLTIKNLILSSNTLKALSKRFVIPKKKGP